MFKNIKLCKRKDNYNEPVLTMVEYGDRELGPLKKHIGKFLVGEVVRVEAQVAYALIGKYGDLFEILPDQVREVRTRVPTVTKEVE